MRADTYSPLAADCNAKDRPVQPDKLSSVAWFKGPSTYCNLTAATHWLLSVRGKRLSPWSLSGTKRLLDCALVLSSLPLVVPTCLALALAVRFTSSGPVLFLQKRMGRYGRTFTIVKFRTLAHKAGIAHQAITTKCNQRFTPIGSWLRRSKLDELPQLWNVIKGDMSLVGPRPKLREHRLYVLSCRPGITGAATLAFGNEETVFAHIPQHHLESCNRSSILPAKRELDADYMAHATFLSDLKIIVKSVLRRWDNSVMEDLLNTREFCALERAVQSEIPAPSRCIADVADTAPMKLAILGTRGIPARYGGFETFAEQLATRLTKRGVEVTVFCPARTHKSDETYRGVTLRYVESPCLGSLTETVWDTKCFWAARRDFDVVYMLGVGAGFAAWIPRLYGSAVWINSDGVEWQRAKWTPLQRTYLALAERISVLFASRMVADAGAVAEYLRKRHPLLRQLSTIAYGAEIPIEIPEQALLDKWSLKSGGYYIVICRLEPENHVLEIVEGFERARSALPLVILGNIEKPNAYVQKLLGHQSDQVRFLGTVFDNDMLTALRYHARAYMHGHSAGGTNPSLLEAMACSNLVIAHENPFNREVLDDSGLHWQTSEELAAIVNAVDESRVDVDTRRHRATEIVRSRYQWDQITEDYFRLLRISLRDPAAVAYGELDSGVILPRATRPGHNSRKIPAGDVARVSDGLS